MSELERHLSGATGRALSRIDGSTNLSIARITSTASTQAAKVDAVVGVTIRGLQGAAVISGVEAALVQQVPAAATRLGHIADNGAVAIGRIIADSACRLGRL